MDTITIAHFDIREFGTPCGPFADDPPPDPGFARLYHGTTEAAAERILKEGFLPFDSDKLLHRTATELGISQAELEELLLGTFLSLRQDYVEGAPDDGAYFADSPLRAGDWAWWGSESEAEAEAARHAFRDPDRWENAYSAFNWTVKQQRHTPVVVAVDVYWESARSVNLTPLQPFAEWFAPPFHRVHEVRLSVPSDSIGIVSARKVERVVKSEEVAERFGLRWGEVESAISNGHVPPPDDSNFGERRWWSSSLGS